MSRGNLYDIRTTCSSRLYAKESYYGENESIQNRKRTFKDKLYTWIYILVLIRTKLYTHCCSQVVPCCQMSKRLMLCIQKWSGKETMYTYNGQNTPLKGCFYDFIYWKNKSDCSNITSRITHLATNLILFIYIMYCWAMCRYWCHNHDSNDSSYPN